MRVAPQVVLTEDQERTLRQWARVRSLPARQVERARVVLLAAAGSRTWRLPLRSVSVIRKQPVGGTFLGNGLGWIGKGCTPPRAHAKHHAPTSSSWLNMLERFFRDLTQNRLRRGIFVMSRS
jgi:hypothetical protein